MQYIISYIISPLSTALFATVGAAIPLGIIICVYSVKEKQKLELKVKTVKRIIEQIQQEKEEMIDLTDKIREDYAQISTKSIEDLTKYTEGLIESINWKLERNVELERYREFIDWAEHYNFWSVLENILEKKYFGEGISRQALDSLIDRAVMERGKGITILGKKV